LNNQTDTGECRGEFFVINGNLRQITEFDSSILRSGISFYEVIKVREKIPLFADDHLERLSGSLMENKVKHAPDDKLIKSNLQILIDKNTSISGGNIRLILHFPEKLDDRPDIYSYYTSHYYPSAKEYTEGVRVVLIHLQREKVHSKIINMNFRTHLNKIISDANAFEGILVDKEGFITEGSKSNFFAIINDQLVTAPEKDVLPGITRKHIFSICADTGLKIIERKVHISETGKFDSCFLSGTSPGILAIRNIGPNRFATSHPLLIRISEEYEKLVRNYTMSAKTSEDAGIKPNGMSAVIIYMSLHGCAEKAAYKLRSMYWDKVDIVNLKLQASPGLDKYSTVIIGGSIHMGSVQDKLRKFCDMHEWKLLTKRLGLYLCHMQEGETAYRQFNEAFSPQLREHAIAKGLFGGEFNLEKMTSSEKLFMSKAASIDESISSINPNAIENFGRVIFHLDKY
jgi:branched-chain amino acid aminotransferase